MELSNIIQIYPYLYHRPTNVFVVYNNFARDIYSPVNKILICPYNNMIGRTTPTNVL